MAYGKQIMGSERASVHTFPVIRVATPKKDSRWINLGFVRKLLISRVVQGGVLEFTSCVMISRLVWQTFGKSKNCLWENVALLSSPKCFKKSSNLCLVFECPNLMKSVISMNCICTQKTMQNCNLYPRVSSMGLFDHGKRFTRCSN